MKKQTPQLRQRIYETVHNPVFDKPLVTKIEPKGDIKFITKFYKNAKIN